MFELVIVAGLGLIAGSFINALVWRVHESIGMITERSVCPDCRHTLGVLDLVPVFSWLGLRGRCRYCHNAISWQYPVVEIITFAAFVLSFLWWPLELTSLLSWMVLAVWLCITTLFIALSVYDIRWYELPGIMLRALLLLSAAFLLLQAAVGVSLAEWLWMPVLSAAGAFGFFYLLHIAGRGKWMGGGDVKLVFMLGLLVAGIGTVVGLFLGFVIGAVYGVALLISKRKSRGDMVPFGPFLLLGFWIAFFWAEHLIEWYVGLVTLS